MGDWLTILIILLILGILLDGWRRMRKAQRDSLKVSRSMGRTSSAAGRDELDAYSAELPNGGARVVAYRETPEDERPFKGRPPAAEVDPDDVEEDGEMIDEGDDLEPEDEPEPEPRRGRIPEQVALNLDESVPILMETEEEEYGADDGRIEPTMGGEPEAEAPKPTPEPAKSPTPRATSRAAPKKEAPAKPEAAKRKPEAPGEKPAPKKPEPRSAEPKPAPAPEEVLIINVMAPAGEQFRGDALLESLLQAGLRYGDMNIFHRYEDPKGGGSILFSLANMVKPGVFDLDTMEQFTTPGVSLFMTLPLDEGVELENVEVFDEMLEAARAIALALGGELKDENRSVLTRQTQEHCRQRIHEFERKQLSRAPH